MVLKQILLVDDSDVIRVATRHFLERQPGFAVCGEAIDGLDAVEKAQELHPDLIILDLAMPRMNGLEAARQLRIMMPAVPIILFTWYADAIQAEDDRCGDQRDCLEDQSCGVAEPHQQLADGGVTRTSDRAARLAQSRVNSTSSM